jgi:hypothetical protein
MVHIQAKVARDEAHLAIERIRSKLVASISFEHGPTLGDVSRLLGVMVEKSPRYSLSNVCFALGFSNRD